MVLECGWSHAVLSCILNGQRGIVDWLFMCLKKERGRVVSLISHHSPFGVIAWQLHIVRIRVDRAGWAWGRLLAGVSSVKLSCQHPCSTQLEVWPYLELLPLLLVVDSCQWDETIRYIWKRTAALTALWLAKMTHLMQPMSVTGTGASGRRQSGWRGWKDPWTCIGEVAGPINEYHAAILCEGEWLLGNWVTGFTLRLSCTKN